MDAGWVAILTSLIFWTFVACAAIGPIYVRFLEKQEIHKTARTLIAQGREVPEELIEALMRRSTPEKGMPTAAKALFAGTIVMCVASGLFAFGIILGVALWLNGFVQAALMAGPIVSGSSVIVGMVGFALFVNGRRITAQNSTTV